MYISFSLAARQLSLDHSGPFKCLKTGLEPPSHSTDIGLVNEAYI